MSQTQINSLNATAASTSTLVLDIKGGNLTAGTPIIVWTENIPTSPNQIWMFTNDGHIRCSSNPNLVLDIEGGNLNPGTQVIVWSENFPASPNQLWLRTGDGHIANSANSNLVLDIEGGNLNPGTPVIVWSENSPPSPNQLWGFTSDGYIRQSPPGILVVTNNGGYVADCFVTYTINGEWESQRNQQLAMGQIFSANIPMGAASIHVKCSAYTGLLMVNGGEKTIFDHTYIDVVDLGARKMLTLTGTADSPSYGEDGVSSSAPPAVGQVVVHHSGGYVARCFVSYYIGTQNLNQSSGNFTAGSTYSAPLPAGASSVHIKCEEDTGLAWEPVKTIFDETYPTLTNATFTISGTTLNPSYSQQ